MKRPMTSVAESDSLLASVVEGRAKFQWRGQEIKRAVFFPSELVDAP